MSKRIVNSVEQLEEFLVQVIGGSKFSLKETSFKAQNEWGVKGGVLSHKSGGFFHVTGLTNTVNEDEFLILYQPQSAFNGLLICEDQGDPYVLIQGRIEPGNSNIGQFGPTIQSTPANYMKLHGGKNTPYLDLFFGCKPEEAKVIGNNTQYDLGKRYYQKSKTLSYVEVPNLIDTEENMVWVSIKVINEAIRKDNFFNTDLRSMLSVFDWEQYMGITKKGLVSTASLLFPLFHIENHFSSINWNLTSISKLKNWAITDSGIVDQRETNQVDVDLYEISCTTREVGKWYQPLFSSEGKGRVCLYTKEVEGKTLVLLSVDREFGVSGESIINPSIVMYPEELGVNNVSLDGEIESQMVLSEEGGRFFKDENIYQVRKVEPTYSEKEKQVWVSLDELKIVLKSSNMASIQLRVISSLLIEKMNQQLF